MAMILDAFMNKCSSLLVDFIQEEVIMLLGVKDELQKLQQRMRSIQSLLKDAEKKKFDESSIDLWLSELKDVMYDADDMIDLCRIEGAQLLADQNPKSKTTPVCCSFSSAFSCFSRVPQRHEIGNIIKDLNDRLDRIYENRKQFKLEKSEKSETPQITQVDHRQTSSMIDPLVVGREVEDDADMLVNHLVEEKVEEKCRLFAVTGMGGIGKTTLAQKVFNHPKIQNYFNLKVWACVYRTYSEIELLKQVIREAKGSYGNADTKSELLKFLRESVVSGESLFLVLDDVWRADVWVDLLRIPLYNAKVSIRVLVTTRDENVAKGMKAVLIHHVMKLSEESSWDMLRRLLFSDGEEEQADELKEVGFEIAKRCKGLPLAIKAIAGVLARKERSGKVWEEVLRNDAWSIGKLPDEIRGAIYLSFEDLSSHLKQCFLYFSLYPEDFSLFRRYFAKLWVAEGFITEQEDLLTEKEAENYFDELLERNLLQPGQRHPAGHTGVMHDVVRSLAIFLSEGETSCGDVNIKNSATSIKLRRLSVAGKRAATTETLDSVAEQGALRTLLAFGSDLLLDDHILRRLLRLRVLDVSHTSIETLPNSIGNLIHLRYLNVSFTNITTIPETIQHLQYLQFLNIRDCNNLIQLPSGVTRLYNLRHLNIWNTSLSFIPKGIGNLQQMNHLDGFVVTNNDCSSKLKDLNSLKQLRRLSICNLERAQSGANILKELPYLYELRLLFSHNNSDPDREEQLTIEKLLDELTPPRSLEELAICGFFGRRFPNWMALFSFEICFPFLTKLQFTNIKSCTQLLPLGQLPGLKEVLIEYMGAVKKIEPEFLGGGHKGVAFPKLEQLSIYSMPVLEEWSFDTQVERNASPKLKLLPCLQKLEIVCCPLLKQLPKGLEHSNMKSLYIDSADSLKSLDNLPPEIEELKLYKNEILEKVCCLPALKRLKVMFCEALSCVEKLDALQELEIHSLGKESLPEWLLILLQQRVTQNDTNKDFRLKLKCTKEALRGCIEGGSHWDTIKHIPEVIAYGTEGVYLRYIKQPYVYDTNI